MCARHTVISMDELFYETLAPARAKRLLDNMEGFVLEPAKLWRGADLRSVLTAVGIGSAMMWVQFQLMQPQVDALYDAKAAICGGDVYFIYAF